MSEILDELVRMSHYLGDPNKPFAILGEGNTSAKIDDDSFYVKASGTSLGTMTAADFLAVSISRVTAILDDKKASDADVDRVLRQSLLDPGEKRKPSVETMLHALLLKYPEYRFIGHTHPVSTNAILCSVNAKYSMSGRLCPDHIVVMGHKSVYVPYVDPGLVLAREVRRRVEKYIDAEGVLPKCIMLQNHGLIAMGDSSRKVTNITDMAEKMSKVLVGAYAAGGPRFMKAEDVRRIDTRPDEHYRQKLLAAKR